MKVSIWDTHVSKKDGSVIHFDIVVPSTITSQAIICQYGQDYLKSINQAGLAITTKECKFCHFEKSTDAIEKSIANKGFYIIELENCSSK